MDFPHDLRRNGEFPSTRGRGTVRRVVNMRSKHPVRQVPEAPPRDEEKMSKIVDEVDRFFKSVHADVEDWKFSVEDQGDGTRIFVRFQIHFDPSVGTPNPKVSIESATSLKVGETGAPRSGTASTSGSTALAVVSGPGGVGAARRADLDLASFVNLWRRKRENGLGAEFHKKGAPYVDVRPGATEPGRGKGGRSR
jgi:hypothetical protein